MSAHGDDLRFFYAGVLGRTLTITIGAASAKVSEALSPGRYLVHTESMSPAAGRVWVRQGPFDSVVAVAAAPRFPMSSVGIKAFEITVRGRPAGIYETEGTSHNGIAVIGEGGAVGLLVITKISRDGN